MFWLLVTLLAAYAFFLEVTIQADLHYSDAAQARIILRYACVHKTWRLLLARTEEGHRLLLADEYGVRPLRAAQFREGRSRALFALILRANRARSFLLKHTRLDRLDALILLRTGDAARSAVLSGTVKGLLSCLPPLRRKTTRIQVLPEFFRAHSTVNARCIIRIRLGTIILTAMMLLAAHLRGRHLTESEAM